MKAIPKSGYDYLMAEIEKQNKERSMSELPNGLDDNAMLAAIAWEIVNLAYLRSAYFHERSGDEVFVKLTNEFIRARQAIYHGKQLQEPK
jgi:hypothetical protein